MESRLLLSAFASLSGTVASLAVPNDAPAGVLLKDVNPSTAGSNVVQISAGSSDAYFVTMDGSVAYSVWATDGTAAGTVRLKTFSGIAAPPTLLGHLGNLQFFVGANGGLWDTDGTVSGTVLLKQVGVRGSPVQLGSQLFFTGFTSFGGYELWRTDGTAGGTQMVKDLFPGSGDGMLSQPVANGGNVFFLGYNGSGHLSLWKSDGTAAGTSLVKDPGLVTPGWASTVGNTIFFSVIDPQGNSQLWSSDGTTDNTTLLKTLSSVALDTPSQTPAAVTGKLFFGTRDGALWTSDGTTDGTLELASGVNATWLTPLANELYFAANGNQLWKSDGTVGGTQQVLSAANLSNLVAVAGRLMFSAGDLLSGTELWSGNGTAVGSGPVKDINPGPPSSSPTLLTPLGSNVYFQADDGIHGNELWMTDGTEGGTMLVEDLNTMPLSSDPTGFFSFDHDAFFFATGPQGGGLYKTDGTAEGTVFVDGQITTPFAVRDDGIYSLNNGAIYRSLGNPGDARQVTTLPATSAFLGSSGGLYYFDIQTNNGEQLWRSDLTSAGTFRLLDTPQHISDPIATSNLLYFFTNFPASSGGSVWRTDGTVIATYAVSATLADFNSAHFPAAVVAPNGMLVYVANQQLWSSDGTVAGTGALVDRATGQPIPMVPVGNYLANFATAGPWEYFLSLDSNGNTNLYQTDGTSTGTTRLGLVAQNGSVPYLLSVLGTRLFFWVGGGSASLDLWTSDGTPAGTQIVRDFGTGLAGYSILPGDGVVYFQVQNQATGTVTWWQSDGTASGTVAIGGEPQLNITGPGLHLDAATYYANSDPAHGNELWVIPAPTPPSAPAAPSGLEATATINGADLHWADNADNETSIRVERSTSSTFDTLDEVLVLTPGTTSYHDAAFPGTTVEYYRVYAANPGGSSADSNSAQVSFAAVNGRAFLDSNYDGVQGASEPGLRELTVYADVNDNGVLDPGEPYALTNSTGSYLLGGLLPGQYTIRQVLPPGFARTSPPAAGVQVSTALGTPGAGPVFADVPLSNIRLDFNYLLVLAQHFGGSGTAASGDLNGDDKVDFADLLLLAQNYRGSLPAANATAAPVSSPMTSVFEPKIRRRVARVGTR